MCETIYPIIIVYRYPYFPIKSPWMVIYHQNLSAWGVYINVSIHCIDLYLHQTAYPLVNVYRTMKQHQFFLRKSTFKWIRVKLGTLIYNWMVTTQNRLADICGPRVFFWPIAISRIQTPSFWVKSNISHIWIKATEGDNFPIKEKKTLKKINDSRVRS